MYQDLFYLLKLGKIEDWFCTENMILRSRENEVQGRVGAGGNESLSPYLAPVILIETHWSVTLSSGLRTAMHWYITITGGVGVSVLHSDGEII